MAELDPERRRALERLARDALRPTAGPRSWGLYRLQLALGGAGLGACALVLAAGVSSVHVAPDAAHRLDVGGHPLHLSRGQRGRR